MTSVHHSLSVVEAELGRTLAESRGFQKKWQEYMKYPEFQWFLAEWVAKVIETRKEAA